MSVSSVLVCGIVMFVLCVVVMILLLIVLILVWWFVSMFCSIDG